MMNWPTKKLGEVADCTDGDWILSKDLQTGREVRLIQLGDIGEGVFLDKTDKWISKKRCKELKCTILKQGDILLARLGDPLGKACIFPGFSYPCITAVDVTIIRVKSQLDPNFLLACLSSQFFRNQIYEVASGTTRKRISRRNLEHLQIPFPPLDVQKRIVKKIEKLFGKIDEAEKLRKEAIKDTENLLKSAMQEVFERGGKGWQMRRVEDCIQRKNKKIKGVTKKKYQKSGKFPVIDQGRELIAGYIDNHSVIFKNPLPVIVFGDHTRTVKYINFPFAIGADGTKILIPIDNVYPKYFYYALSSLNIPSLGYSRHFKILKSQQIPIPSLSKQKQIVAYLDSLSEKIRRLKKLQNQTAHEISLLRQSILDKVFKGEL